ncbi:MAG TPA: MSMEG_0567/sll0787 family protein [Sporichthyaceae bacterium]|nr:MSMEG_0567/sll0787 family protein [Sporichthyaceae bacterium]
MYQIAYREPSPTADGRIIAGPRALRAVPHPARWVEPADGPTTLAAYRALRREVFVAAQGLFDRDDADEVDSDPRTIVLVARAGDGTFLGGVRLGPATPGPDIGWWHGGRLVVRPDAGRGVGTDLVRAACRYAVGAGALRFEADIQARNEGFFTRLGWRSVDGIAPVRAEHVRVRWPIDRIAALAVATKAPLGGLLHGMSPGGAGFVGDDGAPVPGSDLIAACDAILPAIVARDPWWAGWCSVLVNLNDLAAMGAGPLGLLDAVGAADVAAAEAVLDGLRAAARRYGVPVLGGHTTLGVPGFLAVTALGRAANPVPGGGGRPGHRIRLTVDTAGGWRPGYDNRQWDSTSMRSTAELRAMLGSVADSRPAAAKDVSMAGLVGTLGMLAEASGVGAVLDVAAVPRPREANVGDWFTCFPGYAMLTAEPDGHSAPDAGPAVSAVCGRLTDGCGVQLRWPDGELTTAIEGTVTGLGPALTDRQITSGLGTTA